MGGLLMSREFNVLFQVFIFFVAHFQLVLEVSNKGLQFEDELGVFLDCRGLNVAGG
jgi:hypothetical protein